MENSIERRDTGQSVYGVKQYTYADTGTGEELDFGSMVAKSTLNQAAIVEEQTKATAAVLKLRQQKSQDLAECLAILDELMANYRTKNPESDDKCKLVVTPAEKEEYEKKAKKLKDYGYTLDLDPQSHTVKDGCKTKKDGNYELTIRRADAMRGQAQVQEMMDTENNNLQQDMMSLQSFIQKRDRTYSNANEVVKKFENTAGDIIDAMQS